MITGQGGTSLGGEMTFGTGDYNTAATERMRIDEDGNVGVGITSPSSRLHISENGGSTDDAFEVSPDNGGNRTMTINGEKINVTTTDGGAAQSLVLNDNGGNVGVGTASPATKLDVTTSGANGLVLNNDTGTTSNSARLFFEGTGTTSMYQVGNSLRFATGATTGASSGTSRLELDNQGNLKILDNGTNPSASTNNAFLFCDSGELKVLDELGNTTTISPHNFSLIPGGASEDRAWGYYSEKDIVDDEGNVTATQKVNVDMMKLARLVEELTGEKLVYTEED